MSHTMIAPASPCADESVLGSPTAPLAGLWDLGVAGVALPQYLRWADDMHLFTLLADRPGATVADLLPHTPLNARGVDALLGVLCGLQLARRCGDAFVLSPTACEYLDRRRPFYVGVALYGMLDKPLPARLRKGERTRRFSTATHTWWDRLRFLRSKNQWGRPERLRWQHSRNLPAAVVAARSGAFDGVRHLVDVGGGSGVFAIPLAIDRPDIRITLVELPRALPAIRTILDEYGVADRVALAGVNVHDMPWPVDSCDGVLFGNFLHFCADDECVALLAESRRLLSGGGRVFIHEMFWHDDRNGPLVTALWNIWLTSISAGRQRTLSELASLLARAGFAAPTAVATEGGFSLATAVAR